MVQTFQPGIVEVKLVKRVAGRSGWRAAARLPLATQTVELDSTGAEITLVPVPVHELRVSCPTVKNARRLQLTPVDAEQGIHAELDEEKRAVFHDVPAGTDRLSEGFGRRPGMTVQVPCGEVVYEPPVIDSLRVRAVTEGGLAERAGLRDGDLIVAVDGKPFRGEAALGMAFMGMATRAAALTVKRGNRTLEVELGPLTDKDGGRIDVGARLEPASTEE